MRERIGNRIIWNLRPKPKPRNRLIRRMAKNVLVGDWLWGDPWAKVEAITEEGNGAAYRFWLANGETRTFSADWFLKLYRRTR